MDNSPETVLAQHQTGDGAVAAAWNDRQARLAADAATMAAGPTEHMAEMVNHHGGETVARPPGSASDPI
jgi:hypothetical protein